MGFQLTGYLLEKPRVGAANSPFTSSPDDLVSDPGSFASGFPSNNELVPGRVEYLVIALKDGNLPVAQLGWTKNEGGIQRFDYDGTVGNFRPLPGSKREVIGVLGTDSNTTRLKIQIPIIPGPPYRIALGPIGSGTTFSPLVVSSFGSPSTGTVEVLLTTGELNWNTGDLTTFAGEQVLSQQQSPFTLKESTGKLGVVGTDAILLNPIPDFGQIPLLRFGFGLYLTAVPVADEFSFSPDPASETFEWAQTTGLVKFNSGDLTTHNGSPAYYDGILFEERILDRWNSSLTIGNITPSQVTPIPLVGEDLAILAMNGPTIVHQFSAFVLVNTPGDFDPIGKADQVQIALSDGTLRFYAADVINYGPYTITVVFGDFLIERGVSLRLFRSPVNLSGTNPSIKDVTAFYQVTNATLASPIIGAPMVFLPVLPVDDLSHPMSFTVGQGTGSFVGPLSRMDVPSPPAGVGYTLDFDGKQFLFAFRKNLDITQVPFQVGAVALDPFIDPSNATFELNQGFGFVPQVLGQDIQLDSLSGVLVFVTQFGSVILSSTLGFVLSGTPFVFNDSSVDFIVAGVQAGDLLIITAGLQKGEYDIDGVIDSNSFTIDAQITGGPTNLPYQIRRGSEVLADRFFQQIQLPEPHVTVTLVRNSVPTALVLGKDYQVSGGLSTFQTTARLLGGDQIFLTYPSSQDNPDPTVLNPIITNEHSAFLVRKEIATHTVNPSVLTFNPKGRTVATNPAPAVFRGGRPQDPNQYQIDFVHSTITFLPDILPTPSGFTKITDALPHGPIVNPNENIYIDYYIFEALGGENTVVALKPDLILTQIQIVAGSTSFSVRGNRTAIFAANTLLRIETEALYYLTTPIYDSVNDVTTVNLLAPQTFADSATNPKIYMSSGVVNIPPAQPIYFVLESTVFDNIPRGMNQVNFIGDVSGTYVTGEVIYFSVDGFNDFYLVSGSSYNTTTNKTTVTITTTTAREYLNSTATLRRSIRPIYESTSVTVQTSGSPAVPVTNPGTTLLDTVLVYRKVEGQAGQILSSPADFKIDDTGKITFATPLQPNESFVILYSKYRIIQPGRLRSSYTSTIVPTKDNGLLNQVLVDSLTTFIPDSFYVRVETMSNFRGQLALQYQADAKAAAPSAGPRVDNSAQPQLFEQGNKSFFFDEGEFANEDIVARTTLKFYNDSIDFLENILQDLDGRVVGDWDGRFKFDGSTGSIAPSVHAANNQIDDLVLVSTNFPAFLQAYKAGPNSRFYPTTAISSGITAAGVETGDQIFDFGVKPLTGSSSTIIRKFQRALITKDAKVGDTQLTVDSTAATVAAPFRPAFVSGLQVAIASPTTIYIPDGSPITIGPVTANTIDVPALAAPIPAGATVFLSTKDTTYQKSYRIGFDVTLDIDNGFLLYVKPYFPYDGTVFTSPPLDNLNVQAPGGGETLQGQVFFSNLNTAPKKFPALFGQPFDDNGDQRYPLVNPSLTRETGSGGPNYLDTELTYVQSGGFLQLPYTDPPFIGTGSLDVPKTTITLDVGSFPLPVPQPGDLVRILTGSNANSSYHIVQTATPNSVTVSTAFANFDTGFSFIVTVSDPVGPPLSTATTSGPMLTDSTATFVTSGLVKPGYTVVATQAGPTYQRRQVVSVDSDTQLTLDNGFSPDLAVNSYRICKPLNTFTLSDLVSAVFGLIISPDILGSEVVEYQSFFDSVFTDLLSPATASGTFSSGVLNSGVDFLASKVTAGDYVYVPAVQTSEGIYKITQVIDANNLQVDGTPPDGAANFRVVSAFGVSEKSLTDLFGLLQQVYSFINLTIPWFNLIGTAITVDTDPLAYAQAIDATSIASRNTNVTTRQVQVADAINKITTVLATSDKLYDARYVWIDERIDLQTGILVQQQRAVANRIKAQQDALNAMIKLLAVQ